MRNLLALIASVGLVGCVGTPGDTGTPIIDDGSQTPDTDNPAQNDLAPAKKLYDDNVHSIFVNKCGAAVCHAEAGTGSTVTKFVATDAARGWTVATNFTALVGIYTADAPALSIVQAGHKSVAYDTAEKEKITAWLAKELELRQGQPQQPQTPGTPSLPQSIDAAIAKFAGCMTLENFNATNMANAWGNLTAQNNQQCRDCHFNGGEGFTASDQASVMFPAISTRRGHFLQYFTVDSSKYPAEPVKVIINMTSFRGVARGLDPHREHPTFNPDNNQGITALNAFYNRTMQKVAAPQGDPGFCMPKTMSPI